jgi:hypothetical protein
VRNAHCAQGPRFRHDGERAVVVKASRPTIQGNCASADVYSFGIIAWECVTRSDPYGQMPPFQVIFAVGTQGARPAIPPDCPPEMTNLITSAWAEEPADRPSFTEIAVRISGIQLILCSGEPLPPTRLSRVNKSRSSTTNSGVEMHDNAADDATDSSAHISASALPFDDLDDGQLLKL